MKKNTPRKTQPWSKRSLHRLKPALALWIAAVLLLSGCSSDSLAEDRDINCSDTGWNGQATTASYEPETAMSWYDEKAELEAAEEVEAVVQTGYDSSFYDPSPAKGSAEGAAEQNDLAARKLIKNATLTVETKDFDSFLSSLEAHVTSSGGYLSSSSVSGTSYDSSERRYAYLTVRVPADRYDLFLSGVSQYGNVTYKSESLEDVTMTYVDTESRIRAYETEYETLLSILEKAETLTDVLSLQSRITEITYQLESYKAQLRKYDDLISYCTVNINVNEVAKLTKITEPPVTFGQRIVQGVTNTCRSIANGAENFAVWFVSSLPLLALWAAVLFLAVLIFKRPLQRMLRRITLNKRQKAEEAPSAPESQNAPSSAPSDQENDPQPPRP